MQPYDRNRATLTATVRKMRLAEQKPKVKTVRAQITRRRDALLDGAA